MKPFKLCRVCGLNYCESGYCSECRTKDDTRQTITAREVMDSKVLKDNGLIDADIYVDVDGVLFCRNGEILELRDGVVTFLKFLTDNFENVYWLTCWGDGFNEVLSKIYAGHVARKMKYKPWGSNKASVVDFTRDFIWIEDGLSDLEIDVLKGHDAVGNYIHVPFEGKMHILHDITEQIKKRFGIK